MRLNARQVFYEGGASRDTIEFSGSVWAWTALVLGVVVLAVSLFTVTYEFWKPKS
jgi:hypothetical protein